MLNPPSAMMSGSDMGFMGNNIGMKKLPNPANYKIVKCKSYERGNLVRNKIIIYYI